MESQREFTRQILARVGGESSLPTSVGFASPCPPSTSPQVLVVADTESWQGGAVVRESMSLCRFGCPVGLLADAQMVEALRRQLPPGGICLEKGPPHSGGPGLVRAVVAASSPGLLARVALGLWQGPVSGTVLWALWQGLPVFMNMDCVEQGPDGKPSQNRELVSLYRGYAEKLHAMGVQHVGRGEILPALRKVLAIREEVLPPTVKAEIKIAETQRVFITLRDVQKYTGGNRWQLPAGAVVTAAAKDEAARRKIVLLR